MYFISQPAPLQQLPQQATQSPPQQPARPQQSPPKQFGSWNYFGKVGSYKKGMRTSDKKNIYYKWKKIRI